MKRVFLSLGMRGRSDDSIIEDIYNAKEFISSKYYPSEQVEFIHNFDYSSNNMVECLGEAIKKMSSCDHAYFINKWYKHDECIIEKHVCELYDIPHTVIKIGN